MFEADVVAAGPPWSPQPWRLCWWKPCCGKADSVTPESTEVPREYGVTTTLEKKLAYLRVPLYAQARKRPGNPGRFLKISSTKYGMYFR